jgi:hypothetical protein
LKAVQEGSSSAWQSIAAIGNNNANDIQNRTETNENSINHRIK